MKFFVPYSEVLRNIHRQLPVLPGSSYIKYPFKNSGNSLSISYVHVSYSSLFREVLMNHLPEGQQKVNRGHNGYLFGENMRFSVSSTALFCEFPRCA